MTDSSKSKSVNDVAIIKIRETLDEVNRILNEFYEFSIWDLTCEIEAMRNRLSDFLEKLGEAPVRSENEY